MIRLFLLSPLVALSAMAAPASYNLSQLLTRTVEQSPEIKEAYFDVDYAKARLDEAEAGRYGVIEFIALGGAASKARQNGETLYAQDADGNLQPIPLVEALGSRDQTDDYQGLTPFVKGTLTAIVPVWTWGKLSGYMNAAQAGIGVEEAKADIKKHEVIKRMKEFFYGLLLASDALDVGKEVGENVDKAIKKCKELLEQESGEVSQTDLERLMVGKAELNRQLAEAQQGLPLARAAIAGFAGVDRDFIPNPDYLEMEQLRFNSLEEVVMEAWKTKPELKQLAKGLEARKSLVDVEKSERYPIIFLGAKLSAGHHGGRDNTYNPFLNDDGFGPIVGGPALGLRWNLNFLTTEAKVAQAQAQHRALQAKEEFAKIGVPLQIEQAYRKVLEFKTKSTEASEGSKAARRWMVSAVSNYDVGIGDARTLMEGVAAYGMMKISYLKAKYEYNMALANLSQLVGQEVTNLAY